jgi:hypothetical protein
MKYIYYFLLVIFIPVILSSCLKEEKDIFDDSAANRMTKTIEEYYDVFTSAENGWHMAYYVGVEPSKQGGFNLFCKFDKSGNVTIASEEEVGEEITSLYKIGRDQSVILSFDTYNPFIHVYGEPQGGPTTYEGDYEFIIEEVTQDMITMTGKKWRNKIVLTRFDVNKDWTEYLAEANAIMETTQAFSTYKLVVDGVEIGEGNVDPEWERLYSFFTPNSDPEALPNYIFQQNAIYTPEGIQFFEPVEINGKTVRNFKWDEATKTYNCTDGHDIKFVVYKSPTYLFYEEFIGTYKFYHKNNENVDLVKEITIEEKVKGSTYTVTGLVPNLQPITMQYIKTLGALNLSPQYFDEHSLGPVYLFPYSGAEYGRWYTIANGAFKGTFNGSETDPRVVFSLNPAGNTLGNGLGGFIVMIYGPTIYIYSRDTVYKEMSMVKQ